jgi:UDP-MurNAc hydroxylase
MKIKLIRSATVTIKIGNYKILKDPWLTDGEYYGSWSHYPKYNIKKNIDDINLHNSIYVSHIHPDHCSEKTFKLIKKTIPVFIHKFHSPFLKKKIEGWGFNVFELENGKEFELSKNIFISIYAADNCNPELCYKFTGCADLSVKKSGSQNIDSIAVIRSKKKVIVNLNDSPYELAARVCKIIKSKYKNIDVAMLGYGGAGPYPQCFNNLKYSEKKKESYKKKISFLENAFNFLKILKPKYYLPFAGTYLLSGKLSNLNKLRGVATYDEAYDFLDKKILLNNLKILSMKINPGTEFDLTTNKASQTYKKLSEKKIKLYINNQLKYKKLEYEDDPSPSLLNIFELCEKAFERFKRNQSKYDIKLETDIFIKFKNKFIKIPHNDDKIKLCEKKDMYKKKKFVLYVLSEKLLLRILKGPRFAHWNNAEIGSHIKFLRKPNVYERNLYQAMCYFHA